MNGWVKRTITGSSMKELMISKENVGAPWILSGNGDVFGEKVQDASGLRPEDWLYYYRSGFTNTAILYEFSHTII